MKQQIALLLGICLSTGLYAQNPDKIEAESFTEKSPKVTVSKRETGETTVSIGKDQWIKLENVNFGKDKSQVKIRAASGSSSGKASIEIRLGSKDGDVLAKIKIPVNGWNAFTEIDTAFLKEVSKSSDIYIVPISGSLRLDWVEFIK